MKDTDSMIEDAAAPIASALNMKLSLVRADIENLSGTNNQNIEAALNGLFDLMADVVIAVHSLEVGKPPAMGGEY
jgi:hypothetical protein